MATYTLSGSGTQALTSGVVALHITITTLPASAGNGGASPLDYYGVGTLRPGNAAAFWEPFTICGGPQWMPVPFATTRLGYALRGNAVVSVVEVYSPAPLVFPLALLPDVAIASPADTQVLTYQSSSAKWINAAASGGGGGGGSTFGQYRCGARSVGPGSQGADTTRIFNWTSSVVDNDSMLQIGGAHPNRITFTHAGVYTIHFSIGGGADHSAAVIVTKNYEAPTTFPPTGDGGGGYIGNPQTMFVGAFAAGDYASCYVYNGFNTNTYTARVTAWSM